jgi:hypothetical protein
MIGPVCNDNGLVGRHAREWPFPNVYGVLNAGRIGKILLNIIGAILSFVIVGILMGPDQLCGTSSCRYTTVLQQAFLVLPYLVSTLSTTCFLLKYSTTSLAPLEKVLTTARKKSLYCLGAIN